MSTKFILVYIKEETNEITRVGLYDNLNDPKWLKWLSKKKYKMFAKINNIDVIENVYE